MTDTPDLILKNGICALTTGIHEADVAIKDSVIVGIGRFSDAAQVIDCKGLHILPGVIDTQVHFREPGMEHKETLETGMKAAALGGVTAIFEMPNTSPLTITPDTMADKMARAAKGAWCDYAFYIGGTEGNAQDLRDWESLPGVCGVKIFMGSSTGDLLVETDAAVRAVLAHSKRVVAVHSEDEAMMRANKAAMLAENPTPPVIMHPVWRSVDSCVSSTKRLIKIAYETGRRVHVLHISTAEELGVLAQARDVATCEVLPNHLTLSAPECYERLGTWAQQNPPIREQRHQDALWRAVNDGLIDILASDHAPHTREEKEKAYPASPSGMPGVQTLVPIMLDHVNAGRLSLERFVDLVCEGPLRVHQIAGKGRIAQGYDADFTVVDLKAQRTITHAQQASKAGWTPYDGKRVTGWPIMTIIRGHVVMRDDTLLSGPVGQPVRFRECLAS